jgi:hypothetical protein
MVDISVFHPSFYTGSSFERLDKTRALSVLCELVSLSPAEAEKNRGKANTNINPNANALCHVMCWKKFFEKSGVCRNGDQKKKRKPSDRK